MTSGGREPRPWPGKAAQSRPHSRDRQGGRRALLDAVILPSQVPALIARPLPIACLLRAVAGGAALGAAKLGLFAKFGLLFKKFFKFEDPIEAMNSDNIRHGNFEDDPREPDRKSVV